MDSFLGFTSFGLRVSWSIWL